MFTARPATITSGVIERDSTSISSLAQEVSGMDGSLLTGVILLLEQSLDRAR